MLKHEFETLYGKEVGKNEFEVINALHMLNDNETKKGFATRYKTMGIQNISTGAYGLASTLDTLVLPSPHSNIFVNTPIAYA